MRVGRTFWQDDNCDEEEGEMVHILDFFIESGFRVMMIYTEAYLCSCNASFCAPLVEVDERVICHWQNTFGVGGREFHPDRR